MLESCSRFMQNTQLYAQAFYQNTRTFCQNSHVFFQNTYMLATKNLSEYEQDIRHHHERSQNDHAIKINISGHAKKLLNEVRFIQIQSIFSLATIIFGTLGIAFADKKRSLCSCITFLSLLLAHSSKAQYIYHQQKINNLVELERTKEQLRESQLIIEQQKKERLQLIGPWDLSYLNLR